jgi:hypothetical protein
MAIVSAPFNPISSNKGENANPVAGPPTSVTEPAIIPNSFGTSSNVATPIPARF